MTPESWPANQREVRAIAELLPYARNPMTHTPEQVEELAQSIKHFGVTFAPLIDEAGVLIAGHGRILAMQKLGIAECPVIVARGWSEDDKKAYRIADNQHARVARWHDDFLRSETLDLKANNYELKLLAFDPGQLQGLTLDRANGASDPSQHWAGMPEFNQPDAFGVQRIVVHFKTREDVEAFAKLVGQKITPDTKYIWHPEQVRDRVADITYKSDQPL